MDTSTSSTSQPSTPVESQKDGDFVRCHGCDGTGLDFTGPNFKTQCDRCKGIGTIPSESQEKDPRACLDGSAEGTEPVGGKQDSAVGTGLRFQVVAMSDAVDMGWADESDGTEGNGLFDLENAGHPKYLGDDQMEPEDALFTRGLNWVVDLLNAVDCEANGGS